MLRDITLGQYFPGNTFLHRLDPRTKILLIVIYLVALFSADGFMPMFVAAFFLFGMIILVRVNVRLLLRALRPLVIILSVTGFINLFLTPGEPLFSFLVFRISAEGLYRALTLTSRIVMMVMATFLLTYTTSPMALTDGLERLMGPLKWIRVPVHELALIMSMALRFIHTLQEETNKIMNAQKARGADFETGNILKRARGLIPILIPLFVSAFRRADELAIAMESRCYHGGQGRTRMRKLQFTGLDALAGFAGLFLLMLVFGPGVMI